MGAVDQPELGVQHAAGEPRHVHGAHRRACAAPAGLSTPTPAPPERRASGRGGQFNPSLTALLQRPQVVQGRRGRGAADGHADGDAALGQLQELGQDLLALRRRAGGRNQNQNNNKKTQNW